MLHQGGHEGFGPRGRWTTDSAHHHLAVGGAVGGVRNQIRRQMGGEDGPGQKSPAQLFEDDGRGGHTEADTTG